MATNLDIEDNGQLLHYLYMTERIGGTESPQIENLQGGVSNRTVLVERENGESWVLKQALEKLRVQVDWFSPPERVHREADGLRWLARLAPDGAMTPLVFEDFEHHLIAMTAVPQPHRNWKSILLNREIEPAHFVQFATLLGTIELNSALRREELLPVFGDRGFFESLRLEPYYGYTAEQVPEAQVFLHRLMADTRSRQDTLVHGDYSPKNVLVHNDHLILLDHEVIHFGDPGFDLGFSMTHFLSKAHHLPNQRDAFVDATKLYWRTYWNIVSTEAWSEGLEERAVRHTLACLLARVRGRSPLEYLDDKERERQVAIVTELMQNLPDQVESLVDAFMQEVAQRKGHSRG